MRHEDGISVLQDGRALETDAGTATQQCPCPGADAEKATVLNVALCVFYHNRIKGPRFTVQPWEHSEMASTILLPHQLLGLPGRPADSPAAGQDLRPFNV